MVFRGACDRGYGVSALHLYLVPAFTTYDGSVFSSQKVDREKTYGGASKPIKQFWLERYSSIGVRALELALSR